MKEYPNFYETIKEARMRLESTVVLYDGHPHYILTVCDHKSDGIYRLYMEKLGDYAKMAINNYEVPYGWHDEPGMTRGDKMDKFMETHPQSGLVRKMANSPLFNKFRPFPLGMCNYRGSVTFLERSPNRSTYQGLTQSMVTSSMPSVVAACGGRTLSGLEGRGGNGPQVSTMSDEFCDTVMGKYPSIKECLDRLADPKVTNTGVAFHRYFALLRGPLNMLFVAYKGDIVGFLPSGDTSAIVIGRDYAYTREVVTDLNVFSKIFVR